MLIFIFFRQVWDLAYVQAIFIIFAWDFPIFHLFSKIIFIEYLKKHLRSDLIYIYPLCSIQLKQFKQNSLYINLRCIFKVHTLYCLSILLFIPL